MKFLTVLAAVLAAYTFALMSACTPQPPAPSTNTATVTATATQTVTAIQSSTATSTAHAPRIPFLESTCPSRGVYKAIDMAVPGDQKFFDTMKYLGVETIIRYYDWPGQESLRGKIPLAAELAAIKKNGFNFMGVFQHYNSSFSTFTASRGKIDAGKVLGLASQWKQPKGSAVYFGVDGDFYTTAQKAKVREYFTAAAPLIRAAGFRVGMYGSGANCESLREAKLIDDGLCWIAGSSGWSRTKEVLASGKYALKQKVNQFCGGKSLDFNTVNKSDFGQWKLP